MCTKVLVFSALLLFGQIAVATDPPQRLQIPSVNPASAPDSPGASIASLPGAFIYHFNTNVLLPDNMKAFNRAIEAERRQLKPGELKEFRVWVETDRDGTPGKFFGLEEKWHPILKPWSASAGTIRLQLPMLEAYSPSLMGKSSVDILQTTKIPTKGTAGKSQTFKDAKLPVVTAQPPVSKMGKDKTSPKLPSAAGTVKK